jgi:hypothetical protein
MHKTLHPAIIGYIETGKQDTSVRGWAFHISGQPFPMQVLFDSGSIVVPSITDRPDVAEFYKDRIPGISITDAGWSFEREANEGYELRMNVYGMWQTVFKQETLVLDTSLRHGMPSFLVVDDFYTDPNSVRAFALEQPLTAHPKNHKGIRSDNVYRFPGLKERFEQLLGRKIAGWETYGTNGCFQVNIAGDQAVYHNDGQTYAGVLFLTPGAPGAAGTKFYRSLSGVRKPDASTHDEVFRGGFYDSTRFEKLDAVGNVFNRLVLFDAKLIHAADTYFGQTNADGRLIQLFFFDLEPLCPLPA